jgi:hypothetical protein
MNELSTVKPLYRVTQVIWYIFSIIEILLIFRFLLKLIGANAGATFTQFIYDVSYIFVAPFLYVVRSPVVSGSVIEWSTLIALFVYWVIAWALVHLLAMGRPVSRSEAHARLQDQDLD